MGITGTWNQQKWQNTMRLLLGLSAIFILPVGLQLVKSY